MSPTRLFRVDAAARRQDGSTTPSMGRSPFSACNWGSAVVDTVPQATTSALMSKVRRNRTSCFAKRSRISAERLP